MFGAATFDIINKKDISQRSFKKGEFKGTPILTKSITTQIVDGHYSGTVYGFPFGESRNVELQIYDDGRYNLYGRT